MNLADFSVRTESLIKAVHRWVISFLFIDIFSSKNTVLIHVKCVSKIQYDNSDVMCMINLR